MEIRILGPLEVIVDDEVVEIRGAKERALLASLAVRAGSVVSSDRLIDELWGDDLPANPSNALQVRVSRLRKHLGDVVETQAPGYRLRVADATLDAARAAQLMGDARREPDPETRAGLLNDALDLFRGGVLSEFADHEAIASEASRLEALRLEAIEALLDAELDRGRHRQIIGDIEQLVAEHPLRESLRARLMLALYRDGRQADALRAYQDARHVLGEELGIEPGPELRQLEDRILQQDGSLLADTSGRVSPAPPTRPVAPLPQPLNSFVGRSREIGALQELVKTARVVTITGPGGVGKTRLGVEAARSLAGEFGGHLIELAAVTGTASVAEATAEALEIQNGRQSIDTTSTLDLLTGLLADQRVVLVMDNCEHVLDDAASVIDHLVRHTADLRIIATSRERLGLPHERVFPLAPLDVGDQAAPGDAEMLFMERAEAVNPSLTRSPELLTDVQSICRRVDGIPLAVELAASRMAALSAADVLARLDDRFELLRGGSRTAMPRHQTLRAAIDWSHDALDEAERRMFRRLGVTRAAWDLGLAADLVAGESSAAEAMDIVASLVDRSLVVRSESNGNRYRLLETLRAYAREQLESVGELERSQRAFAEHYTAMAQVPGPHARRIDEVAALRAERDNIRRAIEILLELDDVDAALHTCGHLGYFWFTEALIEDERALIERALAAGGSPLARARGLSALLLISFLEVGFRDEDALRMAAEMVEVERAEGATGYLVVAQFIQAVFLIFLGQPNGFEVIDETRTMAEAIGDQWVTGFCDVIKGLGVAALPSGAWTLVDDREGRDVDADPRPVEEITARALMTRGVETLRSAGEWWALSFALGSLARLLAAHGEYEEALALTVEGASIARDHGTQWIEANLIIEAGNIEVLLGRYDDAQASYERGEQIAEAVGSVSLRAFAANGYGMAAHWQGRDEDAIDFHDHAHELYERIGGGYGRALALDRIGFASQRLGDADRAFNAHFTSLGLVRSGAEPTAVAMSLEGLAGAFGMVGQATLGATLLGCGAALREKVGRPLPDQEALDVRSIELSLREQLGDAAFEAAFAEGLTCPLDELVDKAVAKRPLSAPS